MPTATIDDFDLDIQLGPLDPHRLNQPMMTGTRPDSEPCCTEWKCSDDCRLTANC